MKKALLITLLLATATTFSLFAWYNDKVRHPVLNAAAPPAPPAIVLPKAVQGAGQKAKSILNLALPKKNLLMDPPLVLPENKHDLRDLFTPEEKEAAVKVGGHLILEEEKPPEPNAAVWDQVKGAEVGITIKTP